jgi:DNA mismatch repair protein MutL
MGVVQVLPPHLVNRIAAGECVERPASVVKELVENAIDAGARRIDVAVVEGGRELIQVVDDGCGMEPDDLRLCVRPHATSKIREDEDLFHIHTMGFRGEALPSIGAVARMKITSRTAASDVARTLTVDAGRIGEAQPCSAPVGTSVEVRDLFYCVPARRKFLRTPQTEMGQITEQFARLALAQPTVAMSLRHGGRTTHDLPPASGPLARIRDFFGAELADVLLTVQRSGMGVRVEGFVAPPRESRGSGKWEYVFVNGRFVRDRFVSHAVKEAYRSLIDPARFPVVFLFLTVEPDQVDVNVHPTKTEVRWRDSGYVHGQVLAALRDRFLSSNLEHALRTPAGAEPYREKVRQAMVDFFTRVDRSGHAEPNDARWKRSPRAAGVARAETPGALDHAGRATSEQVAHEHAVRGLAAPGVAPAATAESPERAPNHVEPGAATAWTFDADAAPAGPRARAIQIHDAFIVAETPDGLQIIDQHALHERILYERLRSRCAEGPLESQRLLLPDMIRVPADRVSALESHADLLARLGIELTPAGPQSVAVNAFPSLLERVDRPQFVRDLLDILCEPGARPSAETLLHEVLDMAACKAAVKAGDPLSAEEIAALLRSRELAERSSHCPHGRPTTLNLTLRDLERQFKRR